MTFILPKVCGRRGTVSLYFILFFFPCDTYGVISVDCSRVFFFSFPSSEEIEATADRHPHKQPANSYISQRFLSGSHSVARCRAPPRNVGIYIWLSYVRVSHSVGELISSWPCAVNQLFIFPSSNWIHGNRRRRH